MKSFLSRISSRKFLAYTIGTAIFIFTDKLDAIHWLVLTGIFIGGNVAEAILSKFGKKETE